MIPAIVLLISYLLYIKEYKYYFLPIFFIPFIDPKFAILPLLFSVLNSNRKNLTPIIISILIFIILFKPFFGQTVFVKDLQGEQTIIQKSNLYNSIILARIFQNKPKFYIDGFTSNLFENLDPNNYFFGFAPRQIKVDDQNLVNFPYLSIPFILIGLFYLDKNKHRNFIITISISILISLAILTNYDRSDFITWIPMSLIIIYGLNIFDQQFKYAKYYYSLFIIISSIEILRIFIK